MNKQQHLHLNLDLRVAWKQGLRLMSRISLRTGWRTCPLLIHTIAEAQRPTNTRSSFIQAQPLFNCIVNSNWQRQLLERGPQSKSKISQMYSMKTTFQFSFREKISVMFVCHTSKGISVRMNAHVTNKDEESQEKSCDKDSANNETSVWNHSVERWLRLSEPQCLCAECVLWACTEIWGTDNTKISCCRTHVNGVWQHA